MEMGAAGREGTRDLPLEAPENRDPQGFPFCGLGFGWGGGAAAFPFAPEFLRMKHPHLPVPEKLAVALSIRSQPKIQFLVLRCGADPPGETLASLPAVLRP